MNEIIEKLNAYLSGRPGLVPLIGVGFVIFNFFFNLILQSSDHAATTWLIHSNFFLHLGLIISIIGLLIIRSWSD